MSGELAQIKCEFISEIKLKRYNSRDRFTRIRLTLATINQSSFKPYVEIKWQCSVKSYHMSGEK